MGTNPVDHYHYECAIIHIQPVGAANELIRSIAYKCTINIDSKVWFVETVHKCSKSLSQALKGGLNAPAAVFIYGLAAIAKQRPDLILMDIQLPIMDGYTATSRIKSDPALRSIPIIAVTSYALSGEEKKARGGCDYVPKPFSPRQLLAKIRQFLQ